MLSLAKWPIIPRLINSFAMANLSGLNVLLALAPPPAQPGQPQQPFWVSLVPMLLLIAVFYFAMIRPQQAKAKKHAELLKSVKAGDEVVTSSGIYGKVLSVKDRTVTIRSCDSKLEIAKSAIAEITADRGSESSSQP
jgi:preprotein translocase subunit YajC